MMAEFSRKYPRVKFDVYTANADQIKHRMDNGLTDIGLLLEPVDMERYEYIRLPVKERWVAVMPSGVPLARHEYVTVKNWRIFRLLCQADKRFMMRWQAGLEITMKN